MKMNFKKIPKKWENFSDNQPKIQQTEDIRSVNNLR